MKKTLLLVVLVCGAVINGYAQAQGSGGPSLGGTLEYSVGDVKYGRVVSSSTLVVMQSELDPVPKVKGAYIPKEIPGLEVYPSPVDDILYVQPNVGKRSRLEYVVFDDEGKQVVKNNVVLQTGNERQAANVSTLAVGQYTMLVKWLEDKNTFINAYRVQKLR